MSASERLKELALRTTDSQIGGTTRASLPAQHKKRKEGEGSNLGGRGGGEVKEVTSTYTPSGLVSSLVHLLSRYAIFSDMFKTKRQAMEKQRDNELSAGYCW